MAFNFLKKKTGPPDVGQEAESEEAGKADVGLGAEDNKQEESGEEIESSPALSSGASGKRTAAGNSGGSTTINELTNLEFEKIRGKMEALNALIKGYGERISMMSQQIGEVRAMNLSSEKSISKLSAESAKAVDIVKEVKPERLRVDYQKADMKSKELGERIESNKQFMETIMNELKDIRRKIGTFIGTEGLLKLNEDVKKDLIETQQMAAKTKMQADKTEQIFAEIRRGLADSQKVDDKINNLDVNYSGIQEQVEKLKLDHSKVISQDEFVDFKKSVNNNFGVVKNGLSALDKVTDENVRLGILIEKILSVVQQNKGDIADIAMTIGDDHIQRVSDYDNKLASILRILDSLAGQISQVKGKMDFGTRAIGKISVEPGEREVIKKNKVNLENIKVHPEISKDLVGDKKTGVPEKIKSIQKASEKASGIDSLEGDLKKKEEHTGFASKIKSIFGLKKKEELEGVEDVQNQAEEKELKKKKKKKPS